MVAEDDDRTHYEVLGIDRRASKDKIRDAYRERLNDAQAEQIRAMESKRPADDVVANARHEVGAVRDAWQVLSDPVQRQRYDARLGNGSTGESDGDLELVDADDDDDVEDDVEDEDEAADDDRTPARRGGARPPRDPTNRPPGMFSPDHPPTPPTWPPGFTAPPPRARTIALFVDIAVLVVFFVGAQFAGVAIRESIYPHKSETIDKLETHLENVQECKDASTKRRNGEACITKKQAAVRYLRQVDKKKSGDLSEDAKYQTVINRLQDRHDALDKDVNPTQFGITSLIFLVLALLYLIPSTLATGQTLGKRLLAIRVVQDDGSKVGLRVALVRYVVPILVALLLTQILGPLAFALVLFGVLTWSRNVNRQALQDRLAHTLVVDG